MYISEGEKRHRFCNVVVLGPQEQGLLLHSRRHLMYKAEGDVLHEIYVKHFLVPVV
jgi:hypothetical protein